MSSKNKIVYVDKLRVRPRMELCNILDADGRWEELGGIYMDIDSTTLDLIGKAFMRNKSPTWELLNRYRNINGTLERLFEMLGEMDHQRALLVLKPYVSEELHHYVRTAGITSTMVFSSKKTSTTNAHRSSTVAQKKEQMPGVSCKQRNTASTDSKVNLNPVNLNKVFGQASPQLKVRYLNNSQNDRKGAAEKNPANGWKEKSILDKCISEETKDTPKAPSLMKGNVQKKDSVPNLSSQEDCLLNIRQIPYEDIRKATDNFNKEQVLGKGGFGTVYRGNWQNISVAIKRLTPRHSSDDSAQQLVTMKQYLNELKILNTCRFPYILSLFAVSLDGDSPCLISQLMVNGSLEDKLLLKNKTPPLTWSQRSHIAECVTIGLNYLHTTPGKPLVHGDIKSANILLDAKMDAIIGDFGLTREGPGCQDTHIKVSCVRGTECYLPDEYRRNGLLSREVDIHCFGIVLLEMATGLRPLVRKGKRLLDHVRNQAEIGQLDSLRDTKAGEENMIWFQELLRMGQDCSSAEKSKRPPMIQVLDRFEKIKQTMFSRVKWLSSGIRSSPSPPNLSPINIHKSAQGGTSPNKLSISPGASEGPEASLLPNKESLAASSAQAEESSTEKKGVLKRELSSHFPCDLVVPEREEKESSLSDKATWNVPMLSLLQRRVNEFDGFSEESSFQHAVASSNSYTTDC